MNAQGLLLSLLMLVVQVYLVQYAFNYLGPKLAEMHGQNQYAFQLSFFDSFMLVVLVSNLFMPTLVICRK